MKLEDLIGEHLLSGVDFDHESIRQYRNLYEDAETINIVLDGKTYTAVEDPSDGYRSCMAEIKESDYKVKNRFAAVRVLGRLRDDDYYVNDVIEFLSLETGKVVLSVGTAHADDYYPWWVAEWQPENLPQNSQMPRAAKDGGAL